jgi:hypothetical protein
VSTAWAAEFSSSRMALLCVGRDSGAAAIRVASARAPSAKAQQMGLLAGGRAPHFLKKASEA